MKKILGIFLILAMLLSLGMANAQTWTYDTFTQGTDLPSIGYFNKVDRIIEAGPGNLFDNDNYGNYYSSLIYAGTNEGSIEYRLDGDYSYLNFFMYVPAFTVKNGHDHRWNSAEVRIYGDGVLLGACSGLDAYTPPQAYSINVEGVRFLKIEFDNVCFYRNGMEEPLYAIGDPTLIK